MWCKGSENSVKNQDFLIFVACSLTIFFYGFCYFVLE